MKVIISDATTNDIVSIIDQGQTVVISPVGLKGDKGDTGPQGEKGDKGDMGGFDPNSDLNGGYF